MTDQTKRAARGGNGRQRATALLAAVVIAACGDGSGPAPGRVPAALVVEPAADTVQMGRARVVWSLLRDSSGVAIPCAQTNCAAVRWSASPAGVVTLSATLLGDTAAASVVVGAASGLVTVRAAAYGEQDSAAIAVAGTSEDLGLVSAGRQWSCAIPTSGTPYCWGSLATPVGKFPVPVPVRMAGGQQFNLIGTGDGVACARTAGDALYCWTGAADTPAVVTPDSVFLNFSAASPTAIVGVCAFTPAGAMFCGQPASLAAVPGSSGLQFNRVSTSGGHACGITTAGDAYCWGVGASGALGNGDSTDSSSPVLVSGGLKFRSISAGGSFSCAVAADSTGYCWGDNTYGQLGDSVLGGDAAAPVHLAGGRKLTMVSAGSRHACAVTAGHAAYCWGDNANGQLGIGSVGGLAVEPAPVAGGRQFAAVSAGGVHTCAATTAGAAYCWGDRSRGAVGGGLGSLTTPIGIPIRVYGQP